VKMDTPTKPTQTGPNLKALGFNSPMEVIDLLALIKVDGEPIIKDDQVLLNPQLKADTIVRYFHDKFQVKPNLLPYIAATIKRGLKNGQIKWGS